MEERDQPTPKGRKADALRRLQVGGTGLTLVALLVGLSTLLTSETRQDANGVNNGAAVNGAANTADGLPTAEDPMSSLGVEPASADPAVPAPVPPQVDRSGQVGPLVPDLQPDPQLDGAAPRR